MTFYLSRLYCDTCYPRNRVAFKPHECGACFHDTCNKNRDPFLNVHICPDCKGPARFAWLTPEQVIIFQDACHAEGDVLEVLLQTKLIKNRKSAEACMNYMWNKTDDRYPLMALILQNMIENLEKSGL
jgi:hypothetical protein